MKSLLPTLFCALFVSSRLAFVTAAPTSAELKELSWSGGLQEGQARLVIEAILGGLPGERARPLYVTTLHQTARVTQTKVVHNLTVTFDTLEGVPKEYTLKLSGEGGVRQVTGEAWQDWSIKQDAKGTRSLVLRLRGTNEPPAQLEARITAEQDAPDWERPLALLTLTPEHASLFQGFVKVQSVPEIEVQPGRLSGLLPVDPVNLPHSMRGEPPTDSPRPLAFQFHGAAWSLPLRFSVADPEAFRVVLHDFNLSGRFEGQTAAFTLSALARVRNPNGGSIPILSGEAALTGLEPHPGWRARFDRGRFLLEFDGPGEFPITLEFNAAVRESDGWNRVDFAVAPSALQPILLEGLAPETQFQFAGAARPELSGAAFRSFLPPDGAVRLSWKEAPAEEEGKLFYSAEMLSQITVSPGLMRQTALIEGKVMQGELTGLTLLIRGAGEVTRVQGPHLLAWHVETDPDSEDRRLAVRFNQAQQESFTLQIEIQAPLGAFPQTLEVTRLHPEDATRFAGYFRIVNDGAVRLEVIEAGGLSQISPEQFPESDATRAALVPTGNQRFAYRFSGLDFTLRLQTDQILPELAVSKILAYHHGEADLRIDVEIELEIREAPLRELTLHLPRGYALAQLNAPDLADHFLRDPDDQPHAELRLVYVRPASGRQVLQLRLERNEPLGDELWELPRIEVPQARSVRGHVGISADPGFRLTAETTFGLTEVATAFFPRRVAGLQAAFRLSDAGWSAALRVERLPQTVQADVFHLFSIGEGIAYGSSVIQYLISGAPLSEFHIELSNEFFNVEFTGPDLRHWQPTATGYVVRLHTPVSGSYTLLATAERPFRAQGETLEFTGARPFEAQSEQGHTVVISTHQFQVRPVAVSPGLLPLETGEVPAEYRLFFDAPILAAYRYTSRPFDLQLELSPLAQGDSLSLVVDRASFVTRVSKEGQVLTDARYFLKNRGNPHLRLSLPEGTQLWSAAVNGAPVVPMLDGAVTMVPLPPQTDPGTVLTLELKLAARSDRPKRVQVSTPAVDAPVMLAEWKLEPDSGRRLVYRGGSLTPAAGFTDTSGFAQLARLFTGTERTRAVVTLLAALLLIGLALVVWGATVQEGVCKYSLRQLTSLAVGLAAVGLAAVALNNLAQSAGQPSRAEPGDLAFLAPVQQAGTAWRIEVANLPSDPGAFEFVARAWPALFALLVWAYGWLRTDEPSKTAAWFLGWMLLAWAALRWPNGAPLFFGIVFAFLALHVIAPALSRLWRLPVKTPPAPPPESAPAPAVTSTLLLGLLCLGSGNVTSAASNRSSEPPRAELISHQIRVEDHFVLATTLIRWEAEAGRMLPLLFEPAALTRAVYPTPALELVQGGAEAGLAHQLLARESGRFEIELEYQTQLRRKEAEHGFTLPAPYGLINQLELTLVNLDVDVHSPDAVSIQRGTSGRHTIASLVLSPVNRPWIGWKPRSRDLRQEAPVFYAEWSQLYAPSAGVIEGAHFISLRPAQGELAELVFHVPPGLTVTDVLDPSLLSASHAPSTERAPPPSLVSLWRFDPDSRKLRVSLAPAQSGPFDLLIRSQAAPGPLPFERTVGLLSVEAASGQIGLLGFATGHEVQLDQVQAAAFSPINLEDFPGAVTEPLATRIPGLTVRRAFRYADSAATATLTASPVQPDVRVEIQQTLSLGEDRTVLAAQLNVDITRAGIFRLSFLMPEGFDIETLTGEALSHWTELQTEAGRAITLHLRGRTEGRHPFAVHLAGPGLRTAAAWPVPQLTLREAAKHQGTLLIVPEAGMRLQIASRENLTQLDPQQAGIRQRGVLAFRILQTPWHLTLEAEQLDPWIQVTSLQHAVIAGAQVRVTAHLQYQIENTGLKAFQVFLPENAENVLFQGPQVNDFLALPEAATNGLQRWEVRLERRVIGSHLLRLSYQNPLPEPSAETVLRGILAAGVNLQRGFLTLQSSGRLQVRVDSLPPALQPAEWQSIPRALQLPETAPASFTYRLVEPAFALPLRIERHQAARLLPARVNQLTLTSVVSDAGEMLTQVRLELAPGDKRLLEFALPPNARFWFAFVNRNGVWPWRSADRILIPLEPPSHGRTVPVEFFYSAQAGAPRSGGLNLDLLAPQFDLPLENITWRVYLNDQWEVRNWAGALQLESEQTVPRDTAIDLNNYLQNEARAQQAKTREAEQLLDMGNTLLERGAPQQARRAFQSAYGLSTHDDAFNEDARVQLHNLKLQQALVGLNLRQAGLAGADSSLGGAFRTLRDRPELSYTQQDARQVLDQSPAGDNAALMRLAERLIQQQDAALTSPSAIRAAIPEQGRLLTFTRSVAVDHWADLRLSLETRPIQPAAWTLRLLILTLTLLILAAFALAARAFRPPPAQENGP